MRDEAVKTIAFTFLEESKEAKGVEGEQAGKDLARKLVDTYRDQVVFPKNWLEAAGFNE